MPFGEPTGEKLLGELVRTVLDLRLVRVSEGLRQIRLLQEDVQENDSPMDPYREMVMQYTQVRQLLHKALAAPLKLD